MQRSKTCLIAKSKPTKRAPDAGDSAHISGSLLRLIIFLAGQLRRPRPSAGNANRWVQGQKQNQMQMQEQRQVSHLSKVCRLAKIIF
jgi:hypothetical protein